MPVCDICPLGTLCVHSGSGKDAYRQGFARAERVLLDLIAELRERHYEHTYPPVGTHPAVEGVCATCEQDRASVDWPCHTARVIDRAEDRLKGLNDE